MKGEEGAVKKSYLRLFLLPFIVLFVSLTAFFGCDKKRVPVPEAPPKQTTDQKTEESTPPADAIPEMTDNLYYKLIAEGPAYVITGAVEDAERIVIAEKRNGLPVLGIAPSAFRDLESLREVVFVGAIDIGERAFAGCESLTSVTAYGRLGTIGFRAFADCKKLETVDLGDGAGVIGYEVLEGCTALRSVTLGEIASLGDAAFKGCTVLKEITFHGRKEQVETTMGYPSAFLNGSSVERVICTDGVIECMPQTSPMEEDGK